MAIQMSASVRNARLDAIESTISTSAVLKLFSGAQPADCAAANSGTLLASLSLESDWMGAANAGAKAKAGTWADSSADGAGTAAHFRLYASNGTTCHMQGSVSEAGGGGDLILDNTDINAGQAVTISGFTLTEGFA